MREPSWIRRRKVEGQQRQALGGRCLQSGPCAMADGLRWILDVVSTG